MLLYAYYFPTYWLTYLSCQQSSKTFYFVNTPLHLDCLLFEEIAKKMFSLPREDFLWPAFMLKCQTRTVYAEHYIFFFYSAFFLDREKLRFPTFSFFFPLSFNLFVPSFNFITLSLSLPSTLLLSANLLVSLLPPFFLYPPCFFQPPCLLTLQISPTGLPLFPKLLHLLTVSSSLLLKFTLLDPLLCLPNSRRRPHDTLYPMCHFNFRADVVPHCQFHRVYSFKGPL